MKSVIVQDVGFGDSGKGSTTDYLCRKINPSYVVKFNGGLQSAHHVVLPDGRNHCFAQYGSGTFSNIPTYIGPDFIFCPVALKNEAAHLKELGFGLIADKIVVDQDCLVRTPYHRAANRIAERNKRHGSCGQGIGVVREYWLQFGSDAVMVSDLCNVSKMRRKLELLRQRITLDINHLIRSDPDFEPWIAELNRSAQSIASELHDAAYGVNSFGWDQISGSQFVFEGSQGVLLDENFGFHPHTTWSDTTPRFAREMCEAKGLESYTLGVTRAFTTRHGNGPLPTACSTWSQDMTDEFNEENQWQGKFRTGHLDLDLLQYGCNVAKVDGIAVTWLDRVDVSTKCARRKYGSGWVFDIPTIPSLERQKAIGVESVDCMPYEFVYYGTPSSGQLVSKVSDFAPVVLKSFGPTHEDRVGEEFWNV